MAKKPRKTKEQRERDDVEAACQDLSAELSKVVGFAPHIEHVGGVFYKPAGAITLNTMHAITKALKERSICG